MGHGKPITSVVTHGCDNSSSVVSNMNKRKKPVGFQSITDFFGKRTKSDNQ